MSKNRCAVCQAEFGCGVPAQGIAAESTAGEASCWCQSYPAVLPLDNVQDCYCPTCLAKVIAQYIETAIAEKSHAEMLEMARPYRHQTSWVEHIDYTVENGQYVFTHWYHLKRGTCCSNGCRHCPY